MMTTTGMVMGSPGFMSPEQAKGDTVGPPSDVFSLGAVLAYAATGEGPFGTGPTPALLYRVVNEAPRLDSVPPEARPVIEHCLAKDPAARPTSAQLLAQLGGVDLSTDWLPAQHTDVLAQYAAPTSGPRQQAAPGSTAQPGMAAAGPRAVATEIVSPPPGGLLPAGPSQPRPRSRKPVIVSAAALAVAAIVAVVVTFTLNSPATFNGNLKIADYNGAQAVACGTKAPGAPGAAVTITLVNNSPAPITATGLGNGSSIAVPAHDKKNVGALSNSIWRVSGQQQACVSDFRILTDSRIVITAA
jgi:hypothetical protein